MASYLVVGKALDPAKVGCTSIVVPNVKKLPSEGKYGGGKYGEIVFDLKSSSLMLWVDGWQRIQTGERYTEQVSAKQVSESEKGYSPAEVTEHIARCDEKLQNYAGMYVCFNHTKSCAPDVIQACSKRNIQTSGSVEHNVGCCDVMFNDNTITICENKGTGYLITMQGKISDLFKYVNLDYYLNISMKDKDGKEVLSFGWDRGYETKNAITFNVSTVVNGPNVYTVEAEFKPIADRGPILLESVSFTVIESSAQQTDQQKLGQYTGGSVTDDESFTVVE